MNPDDQASKPDPFQNRDDGFYNPRHDDQHLPQDFDPPTGQPSDTKERSPKDYPESDSNIDSAELYDEGATSASGVDDQDDLDTDHQGVKRVA